MHLRNRMQTTINPQRGLLDAFMAGAPANGFLEKLDKLVDWEPVENALFSMYPARTGHRRFKRQFYRQGWPDAQRGACVEPGVGEASGASGGSVWVDEAMGRVSPGTLPGTGPQSAGVGDEEHLLELDTAGESGGCLKRCAPAGKNWPAEGHRAVPKQGRATFITGCIVPDGVGMDTRETTKVT